MLKEYDARSEAIERCIETQKANIRTLRQKQAENKNDPVIKQELNDAALMVLQTTYLSCCSGI